MSDHYDGPVFDATHTANQYGGAVVPERYLDVPQGRIMDMMTDSPGMAENPNSVVRDRKTGHRFIHTYHDLAEYITRREVAQKPFIGKVIVAIGRTSSLGYLLDYRRVRNMMYPWVDLEYDPQIGLESISAFRDTHGTTPAIGVIMRYGGEVHYIGELAAINEAKRFSESIDELVETGFDDNNIMRCPAHLEDELETHTVDDLAAISFRDSFGDNNPKFQ